MFRYVLCAVTLLGSYMYHDIIPWDDDLDLMVDFRDYPKLKRTFQRKLFWSKYNIHGFWDSTNEYDFQFLNQTFPDEENNSTKVFRNFEKYHAVKIFYANSQKIDKKPWSFPFIDIFYYKQNLTHIWQLEKNKMFIPISEFYPLHLRPFMGMWFKVPCKTGLHLKRKYHGFKCGFSVNWWNHKRDQKMEPKDRVVVQCKSLQYVYVEISRTEYLNGTLESVYLFKDLIYSVFIDVKYEIWGNPGIWNYT